MKKLFAVLLAAAALFCSTVYADEGFENPTCELWDCIYDEPFTLDSLPQSESGIKAYSFESYDWMENNNRPCYYYIKENMGSNMAMLYERIYAALYDYSTDYSSYTANVSDIHYLIVPADDLIEQKVEKNGNIITIGINSTDSYTVFRAVLEDNPQFYFVSRHYTISTVKNMLCFAIGIEDKYADNSVRKAENEKLDSAIAEYDAAVDVNASNYAIEKAVHDKIILDNNYEYDSNGKPSDEHYAHSVIGILDPDHTGGVCEAYAKAFQLLMNRYNVPVRYIAGYVNGGGGHAWNAVLLSDGEYHCIDCTWDDPKTSSGDHVLRYAYFNIPKTAFYNTLDTRNNNLTEFPDSLPELSESEAFCNTAYLNGGFFYWDELTSAPNGDMVYPAPATADALAMREVTTFAPPASAAPVYPTAEPDIEVTTSDIQFIAASSPKPIRIKKESGSWSKYAGSYARGSGEISFIADENCIVQFRAILTDGGKVTISFDGIPYGEVTYSSTFGLITPKGRHKILFDSGDSTVRFSSITAVPCGDVDGDGTVTLLDAVALSQITEEQSDANTIQYDADSNGAISDSDTAVILRKVLGLPY